MAQFPLIYRRPLPQQGAIYACLLVLGARDIEYRALRHHAYIRRARGLGKISLFDRRRLGVA